MGEVGKSSINTDLQTGSWELEGPVYKEEGGKTAYLCNEAAETPVKSSWTRTGSPPQSDSSITAPPGVLSTTLPERILN